MCESFVPEGFVHLNGSLLASNIVAEVLPRRCADQISLQDRSHHSAVSSAVRWQATEAVPSESATVFKMLRPGPNMP